MGNLGMGSSHLSCPNVALPKYARAGHIFSVAFAGCPAHTAVLVRFIHNGRIVVQHAVSSGTGTGKMYFRLTYPGTYLVLSYQGHRHRVTYIVITR